MAGVGLLHRMAPMSIKHQLQYQHVTSPSHEVRTGIKKHVDKLLFNFLVSKRMDVLKEIGFYERCHTVVDQSELYVCGDDTEENAPMWETFSNLYNETNETVVVDSVTPRRWGTNLVNNLQTRFKCICKTADLNHKSFDVICMPEDLEGIREYVMTYDEGDIEEIDQGVSCADHHLGSSTSSTSVANTLERTTSDRLPVGFDVGGVYKVFLHVTDLRRLHVDAIVNSANGALKHGSGVARAIKDAAGPQLEAECREIISKQKNVALSTVVRTTAGKLPAKMVLHTVGPKWPFIQTSSGVKNCLNQLERTFYNVLSASEFEDVHSIAIPPISSGVYKVPGEHVAHTMFSAILEKARCSSKQGITDLHLVDINNSILELVAEKFREVNDNIIKVHKLSDSEVHRALKTVLPGS